MSTKSAIILIVIAAVLLVASLIGTLISCKSYC